MKKIILTGLLISGIFANSFSTGKLTDKVKFASIEKAKELLTQEDEFTNNWSQFDIDSRMHKANSTKEELFLFISAQARKWSKDETNKIQSIIKSIDNQLVAEGYKLQFPDEIYFVKTTADEEGGAGGYTRANYVVLKADIISRSKDDLKHTIIHELFHILTRNNPLFRKEMYKIIGFELMNEIEYPDELKAFRITNPDAPQTDSYIKVEVNGRPVECMMILYSTQDYKGGDFFKYLNVGFLSLEGDTSKRIQLIDNKPVVYTFNQISNFFEQVGKNTKYIIHPEEILADNFAFAILDKPGLPNPEIVNAIKGILKK